MKSWIHPALANDANKQIIIDQFNGLVDKKFDVRYQTPAEDYAGVEGSMIYYKDGDNAYRVLLDLSDYTMTLQRMRRAWYYKGYEKYDDAHDYKYCSIENKTATQMVYTLISWTNECQAIDSHFTLYPGDFHPELGYIIPED